MARLNLLFLSLAATASLVTAQFSGQNPGEENSIPGASWEQMMEYANLQPDISEMLPPKGECTDETRLKRKAWHTLSNEEKKEYLDAELCLMYQKPSKTKLQNAASRFDDLVKSHQLQAFIIHDSAQFLPYHRLQMHAHERLLREECGYTGAQPYWDEELEAGAFTKSNVFDPVYGFGGSGTGAGRCIETGPFANYTLHTGPRYNNTEHCIRRTVNDNSSLRSGSSFVEECLQLSDFATAWPCMEENPHNGGHGGVGGEMADPISSPNDPIFYLHHTFLDRVWWRWQEADLEKRLTDIAGYTSGIRPTNGYVNATLDDVINMYGIIPNATIRESMDVRNGILCFEYV